MRVALLTDGIWPYVLGGMQKHSYYIAKYLAQNKVEVDLFHFNQSTYDIQSLEFFSEEEKKFIQSRVIDFPKSLPFPGHYLYNSYRYSKKLFSAIKGDLDKYDFIYSKGFSAWYLIQQKKKGKLKMPPIGVKFHGYEMFQNPPDLKTKIQSLLLLQRPVKYISQGADVVFSYGGKITELIASIGVDKKNIVELPSGLESSFVSEKTQALHKPLRFLFLGRYERRKGVEELNLALHDLLKEENLQSFEMHFVGPIPEEKKIQSPQIIYHGEIRDKQSLKDKIQSCDVLLCPSWSEGFPNVLLEAMGNGLSVLATDVGAVSVLVNKSNGIVIAQPFPEEIKKAMLAFLNLSAEALMRKKENALETIRTKFTWEVLALELIKQIKSHSVQS